MGHCVKFWSKVQIVIIKLLKLALQSSISIPSLQLHILNHPWSCSSQNGSTPTPDVLHLGRGLHHYICAPEGPQSLVFLPSWLQ